MALPLGFLIAQLGMRAVPVMLRTGRIAMRYILDNPAAKEKITSGLARNVLTGRNTGKYVDDVAKLKQKSKANEVIEILDPKKLATSQKEALMNTTYRDMSKLLQSKSSYGTSTKIAGDIQKGFGQSFSKESSGRLFIAGDRTTVAAKEVLKKTADAPKALPKPTATQIAKVEATEAGKAATEAAKGRITAGMGVNREIIKQVPKESRKQIIKLQRSTEKLQKAAKGDAADVLAKRRIGIQKAIDEAQKKGNRAHVEVLESELANVGVGSRVTGEVITEGLRGVGSGPKPAWWQAMVPKVLRVGGSEGPGYAGAYPAGVSGPRVGATTGGLLFAGATIPPLAESMTRKHLAAKEVLSPEQIMAMSGDAYANAYNPDAMIDKLESGDIILPERIE